MSSITSKRVGIIVFTALLCGCPEPSADATVDATLNANALVIAGTADEEQYWGGTLTIDAAPAGEYVLFASPTRPTSLAGLSGLDVATCTPSTCNPPGLGTFVEGVKLDAPGPVKLRGPSGGDPADTFFFVLIRRGGGATDAPVKVGGRISIAGNPGCGGSNPAPPSLTPSSLDGAPPITELPARADAGPQADAGAQADASSKPAPSCAALKTQLEACPSVPQPSKDGFATFCAGISEGCRGCLDGALCGVTEQCDPLCGK